MISIVVTSYNNEKYISKCIDSALSACQTEGEVIVVDDGSTDGSKQVIESYGDRITALSKENGGQLSAYIAGFKLARFDWLLFLDCDDAVDPKSFAKLRPLLQEGVSKLQYRLGVVDSNGNRTGELVPSMKMGCMDETKSLALYGEYASPPGSGAIYSRSVLEKLFPLIGESFSLPTSADAPLYILAPSLGRVVSVNEVCGFYRKHDSNICNWSKSNDASVVLESVWGRYLQEKKWVSARIKVCRRLAGALGFELDCAKPRMISELKVIAILAGVRGIRGFRKALWLLLARTFVCPGYSMKHRLKSMIWCSLFALPLSRRSRVTLGAKVFQ